MEMNHGDPSRRVTRNVRTHTEADQSEVGAVCVCGATLRLAQPFTMRYTDCTQSVVSTHRCGTVVACAKPATSPKCLLSTVPTEEMGSNNLRAARPPAPCCELWVPDPARRATKFPCGGYEGALRLFFSPPGCPPGRHSPAYCPSDKFRPAYDSAFAISFTSGNFNEFVRPNPAPASSPRFVGPGASEHHSPTRPPRFRLCPPPARPRLIRN